VIDAPLYVLNGTPTVVAGGINYTDGDLVGDGLGNVLTVHGAGGTVATVSVFARAEGRAADASGTVACATMTYSGGTVGTGLTVAETWAQTTKSVSINPSGGPILMPLLTNAANDAAAATAGIAVGRLYRNGSILMQRAA
jgi:hypothetical protein